VGKSGGLLAPGPGGNQKSVITSPTLYDSLPTDVPQDFSVVTGSSIFGSQNYTLAAIPDGSNKIEFSANDVFFSDNADPNRSYKVSVVALKDVISGSVSFSFGGVAIIGVFKPNLGFSLAQAAALGGFSRFNWQQQLTQVPDPNPYRSTWAPNTPLKTPFPDPPPGGYTDNPSDAYPFYYDSAAADAAISQDGKQFGFEDNPGDSCLAGGDGHQCNGKTAKKGAKLFFKTTLVGVDILTGLPVPLYEIVWSSSNNLKDLSSTANAITVISMKYLL
jgi:hypothetical protein